ncbi:MAG TPA: ChbG/HpnK family deacetylase [Patescibacteria group bacterium]|nr:ChbG/HpnK family deacetylase [Patescibacteria group bacterium]
MKRIVIVADDFGLCTSVNNGIVTAHEDGIVTELSLMLGSPGTDHAVQLAREHNIKNVGIHVLLKHWREHGDIFRRNEYQELFANTTPQELQELLEAEVQEFKKVVGHMPTHITSQYGIISDPKLLAVAIEYAAKHHIPMRLPAQALRQPELVLKPSDAAVLRKHHVTTTDYFFGYIEGDFDTVKAGLIMQLQQVHANQSVELMLHPGNVSKGLRALSSMVDERARDVRLATDRGFKEALHDMGFTISTYSQI